MPPPQFLSVDVLLKTLIQPCLFVKKKPSFWIFTRRFFHLSKSQRPRERSVSASERSRDERVYPFDARSAAGGERGETGIRGLTPKHHVFFSHRREIWRCEYWRYRKKKLGVILTFQRFFFFLGGLFLVQPHLYMIWNLIWWEGHLQPSPRKCFREDIFGEFSDHLLRESYFTTCCDWIDFNINQQLPGSLTCPLKDSGWKTTFHLTWSLFRGHVNFQGCNSATIASKLHRL